MSRIKRGFEPVYDAGSRVLILGSFPSVKSRQINFYYGNPRNRFWGLVCGFFGEEIPESAEGKKNFLLRRGIALWDVVEECEIIGSKDDSIKNYKVADIRKIIDNSEIADIIINGGKAYDIFEKYFKNVPVKYVKLPSTSPANVKFDKELWINELSATFGRT